MAVAISRVLVFNAGSRSLKWSVLAASGEQLAGADEPWAGDDGAQRGAQLSRAIESAGAFDAVGHRVVHGGTRFLKSVFIDEGVRRELSTLSELAPDHMKPAVSGIDAVSRARPGLPQVAAFDTAFHASMPEAAQGWGLPEEWAARFGLRRFGFHGLSVAHAVARAGHMLGAVPARMVVAHLGGGCSVTAVAEGRSVDTTMGFTPLEGLVMSTRAGSVDPGALLHALRQGQSVEELEAVLSHRSGLLGLSGLSADFREVLAASDAGSPRARLAYERFLLSLRRGLGAAIAVLGGLDALVFTGGIGENSARLRQDACESLAFAGLTMGVDAGQGDRDVAASTSAVRVLVVRAREDLVILGDVLELATQPK